MENLIDSIRLVAWGFGLAVLARFYWQYELQKAYERRMYREGRNLEGKYIPRR